MQVQRGAESVETTGEHGVRSRMPNYRTHIYIYIYIFGELLSEVAAVEPWKGVRTAGHIKAHWEV